MKSRTNQDSGGRSGHRERRSRAGDGSGGMAGLVRNGCTHYISLHWGGWILRRDGVCLVQEPVFLVFSAESGLDVGAFAAHYLLFTWERGVMGMWGGCHGQVEVGWWMSGGRDGAGVGRPDGNARRGYGGCEWSCSGVGSVAIQSPHRANAAAIDPRRVLARGGRLLHSERKRRVTVRKNRLAPLRPAQRPIAPVTRAPNGTKPSVRCPARPARTLRLCADPCAK